MTFQPLTLVGMHTPREYSNPFTSRNAYVRGRAKGAVDQSLARVLLTRTKNMVFPFDVLIFPPVRMYICAYTYHAYVLAHERIQGVA